MSAAKKSNLRALTGCLLGNIADRCCRAGDGRRGAPPARSRRRCCCAHAARPRFTTPAQAPAMAPPHTRSRTRRRCCCLLLLSVSAAGRRKETRESGHRHQSPKNAHETPAMAARRRQGECVFSAVRRAALSLARGNRERGEEAEGGCDTLPAGLNPTTTGKSEHQIWLTL